MTVRACLFDLGGVILRTEYQAPREHLAERLNLTYEDLVKIVFDSPSARQASVGAISAEQHWAAVATRLGQPASEIHSIREEFFAGDVVDRNLVGFINSLRPRRKTAIVSNGWLDSREFIRRGHFEEAFDALILSAEVGAVKPEHRIFEIALQQVGVPAPEAVFVDDMPTNVETARDLGMHGLVFREPEQLLLDLKAILD
jgi:epoxide hydrolase-like predicted phosphatase